MAAKAAQLRAIPSVHKLLTHPDLQSWLDHVPHAAVLAATRVTVNAARQALLRADAIDIDEASLIAQIQQHLQQRAKPSLRTVINATGVILHTNLGRAPLSAAAQQSLQRAAQSYSNLEYDLQQGRRGSRWDHASADLQELTGAEAALVVNNNAAALMLILMVHAREREVLISRGQLVEIGGGFRIPAILRETGAELVEVGTTNRTRTKDFAAAISERSAILLRVHASNFKQIGYVEQPRLAQLAALAQQHGLLAVDDLGSGTLLDTAAFGLQSEPTIGESIAAGMDLVCFSGDKLLGGPQAGIIVGKAAAIAPLKRHPLARALRVDKLSYAALLATLQHYRRGEATAQIPVWQMIAQPLAQIQQRAEAWAAQLGGRVIAGESTIGGGSLPGATLPSALLAIDSAAPQALCAALRRADTPIIARIAQSQVLLDPRTVLPGQEATLLRALEIALAQQ